MSCTMVRSHTRRGHQVRSHTRRTNGSAVTDVLARDLDRMYGALDRELADRPPTGPVGGDPACLHPGWYPVRRLLVDTPYEDSPILAYCCTGCAASRPAEEATERALTETEERV